MACWSCPKSGVSLTSISLPGEWKHLMAGGPCQPLSLPKSPRALRLFTAAGR